MAIENTIKNSFRAVKGDIIKIQGELINLKTQQAKILQEIESLKASNKTTKKVSKKKASKKK